MDKTGWIELTTSEYERVHGYTMILGRSEGALLWVSWVLLRLVGAALANGPLANDDSSGRELIVKPEYESAETAYSHFLSNGLAQLDEFQITNLILTSDIEGNLNAVNRKTGELLWSLVGGLPLVNIHSSDDDEHDMSSSFTTPISAAPRTTGISNGNYRRRYGDPNIDSANTAGQKYSANNHPNNNKRSTRNEITWIVEPYGDGTVYQFTGNDGLEKLPLSVKEFVLHSPFSIDDRFVYTGKRSSGIVKVNARTGAIVELFGLDGRGVCSMEAGNFMHSFDQMYADDENCEEDEFLEKTDMYRFEDESAYYGSHDFNSHENEAGPFITLGKTIYDLTIHSKNNTSWNITYVQWGPNNVHSSLIEQNSKSVDDVYIQPFHDSSLLALDIESKSVKWVSNLPYVTIEIFDVFLSGEKDDEYIVLPHPLDHETSPILAKSHESTFLDKTKEGSWFALSEKHYPSLVRSAPLAKYITNERWRLPSIFANDDLLEISICGVHDNSLRTKAGEKDRKEKNNHLAVYPSATAMNIPVKYSKYELGVDTSKASLDSLDKDLNLGELENIENDSKLPTSTFKPSSLSQLLYRAFENIFVALICLGVFYIMSKLGLLQPFFDKKEEHVKPIAPVEHRSKNTLNYEILKSSRKEEEEYGKENDMEEEEEDEMDDVDANDYDYDGDSWGKEGGNQLVEMDCNLSKQNIPDVTQKSTEHLREVDIKANSNEEKEDTTKRKRKRGSRGGKKNKRKEGSEPTAVSTIITSSSSGNKENFGETTGNTAGANSVVLKGKENGIEITKISNNLSITNDILGFGSHGTIVFKGYFENRSVAVKRMLLDFYDVASHEINLLQESDDHSNVVRYFCSQEYNKFLYIALELCSASLEEIIEKKKDLGVRTDTKDILYQIANGVNHLHSLKIVHRDIKPQNILVATSKKIVKDSDNSNKIETKVRFLISDFGLCKKLDSDQSSFRGTTANAAGTSGWRAPELLLDTSPAYLEDTVNSKVRLTRSVDIFSAGCVFYYVLTGGYHPFGDRYIREGNIIKNEYDLSKLNSMHDSYLIKDLVGSMIQKNPMQRPDIHAVLKHPYFWATEKKLEFLLKVSDRFESERRDPPSELLLKLEGIALAVVGAKGWFAKFDDKFIDNLGKYRKYNPHKLMDLLRAIRNKYHHYQDLPKDLASEIGTLPDGFYRYFTLRFPRLLLSVYRLMADILGDDELLGQFF